MKNEGSSAKNRLIYGLHPIQEALQAGQAIEKILLKKDAAQGRFDEIKKAAKEKGIPMQMVPEAKFRRILPDVNHQGIVAYLSPVDFHELEDIILALQAKEETPFFIMLDGISDVRNFGAIARTAECMGAQALIIPTQRAAAINGDAVKVSAGALHHLPICRSVHLPDALLMLQAYGIQSIACSEKGQTTLYEVDFTGPICLVVGSEDKGISNPILKKADQIAQIPLTGKVQSLNVSVAAGMFMAEALRQRKG